jgi:hypothetical protein
MPGGWLGWFLVVVFCVVGTLVFLLKKFVTIRVIRQGEPEPGNILARLDRPAFEQAVRDHCASIGKPIVLNHDFSAQFQNAEDREGITEMNLRNLALLCARYKLEAYAELVRTRFESVNNRQALVEQAEEVAANWELAKYQIVIKIYNDAFLQVIGPEKLETELYGWRLSENLVAIVMLDFPEQIMLVYRAQCQGWPEDKLVFERAMVNTRALVTTEPREDEFAGAKVWSMMDAQEHYIASAVLWLGDYPRAFGTYGAAVGLPSRGCVMALPIHNVESFSSLPLFAQVLKDVLEDLPGEISPLVYWCLDGTLEPFSISDAGDGKMNVLPGPRLMEKLKAYKEQQGSDET